MQLSDYQRLSRRTQNTAGNWILTTINASMGLTGESIELLEQIRRNHHPEILNEMGDTLFYTSWLADQFNLNLEELANTAEYEALNNDTDLLTSTGRILETIKKLAFHNKERTHSTNHLIREHLTNTLAQLHYIAASINTTLNDAATHNINKLQDRYPNGFPTQKETLIRTE